MIQENDKERLKLAVPVPDVLARLGFRTEHRGYMYYSPFRDESEPSLSYDARRNLWYDHGSGEGGDCIRLVMLLCGLTFTGAVELLRGMCGEIVPVPGMADLGHAVPKRRGLEVTRVSDTFGTSGLVAYAESRGVNAELLSRYCREVTYRNLRDGRTYTGIGFRNNDGGYVLRSDGFKGNTGSAVTTLDSSGRQNPVPSCGTVLVFEGFFNFLSWLVLRGTDTACLDVVVLNSVNNVSKAATYISEHGHAEAYLDNDAAGRRCLERIRLSCPETCVLDCSQMYAAYNDINEYLAGMQRRDKSSAKDTPRGPKL